MRIGVSGAHCGILCQFIAAQPELSFKFIKTNVKSVFDKFKMSYVDYRGFNENLAIHTAILEHCENLWENEGRSLMYHRDGQDDFITDRTPLDFMAYLLSDIDASCYCFDDAVQGFLSSCYDAINIHFDKIFYIHPDIPYIGESGVYNDWADANAMPYMRHLNYLMQGLANDSRMLTPIVRLNHLKQSASMENRATSLLKMLGLFDNSIPHPPLYDENEKVIFDE